MDSVVSNYDGREIMMIVALCGWLYYRNTTNNAAEQRDLSVLLIAAAVVVGGGVSPEQIWCKDYSVWSDNNGWWMQ